MSRYLIFRTDRIGDFIFSRMLTNSIKKKNPKNKIDFICSNYNSKYVKNYKDINKIYILDKYNLILMIKNMIQINNSKYDYIIILDGKRRSVFFLLEQGCCFTGSAGGVGTGRNAAAHQSIGWHCKSATDILSLVLFAVMIL